MQTRLKCNVQPFGDLFSCDGSGTEVEWTPTNFAELPLEYSIIGDTTKPSYHAAETILDIVSQPQRIEAAVLKFLTDQRHGFTEWMLAFELEHARFDDICDSNRYVASCLAEFNSRAPAFPPVGCAGNGFWNLKFRMFRFDVVEFILDDCS